ncbi:MAG TPA: hypothetical protein VHB97_24155 [Polyangia bacterium]|nr:hypothetical protein [Polyangia bacterium]
MRHVESIVLEDRLDPILIWHFRGVPSDGEFDAFWAAHERLLDAGAHFLTIIDGVAAELPTPAQVRRQAAWLAARAERLRALSLGVALVLPSQPLRRALLCMTAWRTVPGPHVLCPHMAAAMLWAEARLLRTPARAAI